MKPQTKENKKKLSTIAKRLKKDLPLTGLVSSPLAPTGCTPETSDIAPNTAGDIAPEPNTTEEIRKTSEMRPVPGEPPIAPEPNTTEEVRKTSEIRSVSGMIAPPPAEKTEDTKK